MATNSLGRLTLDLVARIGQFVEPMNQAERQSRTTARNMQQNFEEADNKISLSAKNIGASVAGVAASYLSLGKLIDTQRTFDKLNAGLITATGSAEGAARAFDTLQKFAKETPYGLEQSIQAFIRLKNLGLNPSETALMSYGNTAAAMGGDLMQMIEAVADATTGEFERLKAFGIKASQENGKVALNFRGQTTTITNSAKEIERYLLKLGNVDFANASINRMKTLDGSILNLQDNIDSLFLKVSQSGIGDAIKSGVDGASNSLEALGNNLDTVGDIALVVGAIFAARYSTSVLGSIKGTIAASAEQRQALIAEQAASVQLLGVQAQRARQNAALALTEVNLARAEFNNATTSTARAAAIQRLTAANVALAISDKQATIATAAYTTAASAATGATSRLAGAKALLLGLTGGWVGLGVTVASVAAGYLLMRDNGNEANAMLDQQQAYAGMAATELTKLEGAQRRAANESLSLEFETQSSNLKALQKDFTEYLADLTRQYKGVAELERIYGQLRAGTIDVEQAFQMLNQVEVIKTSDINRAADFEKKHKEITSTLSNLKPKLDQVSKSTAQATGEFEKQKTVIEGVKEAYEAYMKTFNADVKEAAASNSLVSNFKLSENEKAEILKVVQAFGYDKAKLQTEEGRKAIDNAVKLAGIRDKQKTTEDRIAETEKKATEQKRLQLEYARKQQIILAGTDERTRNMLKVYQAFMNTGALSDKQARYLTAEVGRENDFKTQNLYGGHIDHNNGAKNLGMLSWQKDRAGSLANSLRSKNLIDSSGNIKQVQEALDAQAAFFVNELFNAKRFAPSKNALLKNADYSELSKTIGKNGIAWDYDGRKINALPHHQKRDGYFGQLNTILGPNPDGMVDSLITSLAKRDDEMYNYAVKIAEDQKEIQERYYTEWQKLEEDNQEKIKDIQEKFANDPAERDRLLSLQQKSYQDDVENWIKTQDEKVETERQANWRILEARYDLLNSSKAMYEKINSLSVGADDIFAQATMSPKAYAEWSLDSQRGKAQVALGNQRIDVEQDIMSSDTYATDEDRYEALQEAYQQYRDGMAAIDVKYYQDLENLQNQSQAASLAGYGAMFGMMGSMLDAYGEKESTAYKLAFAMQKGFVLASAIMNAKGAIMSAWNDPANVTIWQKMASAAAVAVQTNELMSAIQGVALTGFSSGGYTGAGGKYDIAGTVHKGEVVFSQEDVARWGGPSNVESLRKSSQREFKQTELVQGGTNVVAMQPKVTINNYSSEKVETSTNQDGELLVTIGKMVNSMVDQKVDQRFLKARRQGGELYGIK